MRLKEKIVRTPSVYSMTDAEVYGVFFWCCVDDARNFNATVGDESALEDFEKSFFSWTFVRNDQYLPQRPVDNDDYIANLLFWVDDESEKPGYVFRVRAEDEGLKCALYSTKEAYPGRSEFHHVCTWRIPRVDIEKLFTSNDDKGEE